MRYAVGDVLGTMGAGDDVVALEAIERSDAVDEALGYFTFRTFIGLQSLVKSSKL